MLYQSPYLQSIPLGGEPASSSLSLQPLWADIIDLDYRLNGPGNGLSPAPATIKGQPKKPPPVEGPKAPEAAAAAGKPGQVQIERKAPSYSKSPGSRSESSSASRSYDYSGYDDHIKRQDTLANARDAKKSALFDGDTKSAMLAGNKVRELVAHLRRDAPGTSERDPYQFKTPLRRLASSSDSTSTSNSGGSSSYDGPAQNISVPTGGGRAARGQQVLAGIPRLPPPPPLPAARLPPVKFDQIDAVDDVQESQERDPLPASPELRFERRMRRGMMA